MLRRLVESLHRTIATNQKVQLHDMFLQLAFRSSYPAEPCCL